MSSHSKVQCSAVLELSPRLAILPVAFQSVFFANEVRRAVAEWRPTSILVELPKATTEAILEKLIHLPMMHAIAWERPSDGNVAIVALDPCDARIEALRLAEETGIEAELIDLIDAGREDIVPILPAHAVVERLGTETLARKWLDVLPRRKPTKRERIMAGRIARRSQEKRTLAIVSFHHLGPFVELLGDIETAAALPDAVEPETPIHALKIQDEVRPQVLGELPAMMWSFNDFREFVGAEGEVFPVTEGLIEILRAASDEYAMEFDEQVSLTEWRAIVQYARNLALVHGRLTPGMEELVTAACGCVDDDFGAAVFDAALDDRITTVHFDFMEQEDGDEFEGVWNPDEDDESDPWEEPDRSRHRSKEIYFDLGDGLRRTVWAYPRPELKELEFKFKRRRPTPLEHEQWQREFEEGFGYTTCSWPPEDERIEKFFDHLRKRALASVSEDLSHTEEFQSSMLDGLDFRETTRNWHTGKLFVRRERQPPGKVGPVVLVWHDFPLDVEGLWKTTLYAENQNESDISIFCAPLGEHMVGPGISRTEYHGVLSIYPARGIPDLWQVPFLQQWETCARLLLAAAILLSEEKFVAWVAPVPPDSDLVQFARERGIGIVHLPLDNFSRKTLKRIRKVHILGSYEARSWGADYIDDV